MRRAAPVVAAVATSMAVLAGCGGPANPKFDGAYFAGQMDFAVHRTPGASVDFFARLSGPPGATIDRIAGVIPVEGYAVPTLIHQGGVTSNVEGGGLDGWPIPGEDALGHPDIRTPTTVTFGVTGYRTGVYAVGGALIDVSYEGRTYTVRAISTAAFAVNGSLSDQLADEISSVAPRS